MRDSSEIMLVQHIVGTDNPANFFTKVLGPSEFRRESANLMSTTDVPESMMEAMGTSKMLDAKKLARRPSASRGHGD
jgi:hypothetical protein